MSEQLNPVTQNIKYLLHDVVPKKIDKKHIEKKDYIHIKLILNLIAFMCYTKKLQ